jgi:hypothetical protein
VEISDHFRPFHLKAVLSAPSLTFSENPTAQHSSADTQDTPLSALMSPSADPAGLGTEATDHLLPFHRSAWFSAPRPDFWKFPTAQHILAEEQETPASALPSPEANPPGLGTKASDHFRPFQCTTWLTATPRLFRSAPTAQQFAADVQDTPVRTLALPGCGTD